MVWFYLSIGAALSFASLGLLSRVVSLKSKNPRLLSVIFNLSATLMSFGVFFASGAYRKIALPTGWSPWLFLSLTILSYGLYERLRFYMTKSLEASHLTIISNTSLVVAVIISFILYSEPLTSSKISGFLLILFSLVLVSIDGTRKINWRGVFLAILGNCLLGIGWALDKKGMFYFNLETYNLMAWSLPLIVLYFPYIKLSDLKNEIKVASWKVIVLAFLNVFGYLMNLKALSLAEATKVIPVVQTSTIFTVIFGLIFLKERKHVLRKIIAAAIAVFGVYLLV